MLANTRVLLARSKISGCKNILANLMQLGRTSRGVSVSLSRCSQNGQQQQPQSTSSRCGFIYDIVVLQRQRASLMDLFRGTSLPARLSYTTSTMIRKDYPPHTIYPMPALSPTMENGTITSWFLKEGDEFSAGTSLCSIETDKASVDFEAQDDGILAKILKQGPDAVDIRIGTPICVVVEDPAIVSAFADFITEEVSTTEKLTQSTEVDVSLVATVMDSAVGNVTSILLPSARHLAESKGLDATVITGSAKGGRVTKGDVIKAIAAGSLPSLPIKTPGVISTASPLVAAPQVPAKAVVPKTPTVPQVLKVLEIEGNTYQDQQNNKMRKIIASRLTESKRDVPHFYTSMEVELDEVMKLRKSLASVHDVKVSVNDFIIRCSALALRDVPEVNATYDYKSDTIRLQPSIDISVAVATPTGLITPIVFNTDQLGLSEIANTIKDLAARARDGKLSPSEYQGGSFCVSNLGMFGIDEFSAVINPPQAAILAVGGGTKRIMPTPYVDGAAQQIPPTIKTIMTSRLSADRRVVDEAIAALFMSAFRHYLNKPQLLIL